jgi:hypothetical protein
MATSEKYVGPCYELPSGRFSFRVGKRKLSGGTFRNETLCKAARRVKIAEFERGEAQAQPNKNFGEVLDELDAYECQRGENGEIEQSSLKLYREAIKNRIRPAVGHLKLKQVTHNLMQKFQKALISNKQYADSVTCRVIWRHAFDLCVREGYGPINLARVGEPLAARKAEPRTQICTDEQYARLIAKTAKGWHGLQEYERRNLHAAVVIARYTAASVEIFTGSVLLTSNGTSHPTAGFGFGGHGAM